MGLVLKPVGLAGWREALAELQRRLGELFGRPEPRRQAGLYLEGLLGPAERKNGWQLAEAIGDRRPWRTQRVLSHVLWDQDKARDLCRGYVVEHLGAPDGVLIVDETACPRGFHGHVSRREPSRPAWRASIRGLRDGSRPVRSVFSWPMPVARAMP
jgi:SRSO17 transposase